MRRGTTPTISLYVEGFRFDNCRLIMTIEQCQQDVGPYPKPHDNRKNKIVWPVIVEKKGQDVRILLDDNGEDCVVAAKLTQDETMMFATGTAHVQLRWINQDDTAGGSIQRTIYINPILTEGEIIYGDT